MSSRFPRPRTATGALPALAGLLAGCLLLVALAPGARAHEELIGTDPAAGESLEQYPQEVELRFSGELTTLGARVEVTGPVGSTVDGEPQIEANQLRQPLSPDAPPGDYEVVWRVTSQDGHPISGTFGYTITEGETPTSRREDSARNRTDRDDSTQAAVIDRDTDGPADAETFPRSWVLVGAALLALLGVGAVGLSRR